MTNIQVALVTRGGPQPGAVAALVPHLLHEPVNLTVYALQPLPAEQRAMLEKLAGEYDELAAPEGCGRARGFAIATAKAAGVDVLALVDDDVVVTPTGGIMNLAAGAAKVGPWWQPIIRFSENHVWPLPGHHEVWHPVTPEDERFRATWAARGYDWAVRTFDLPNTGTTRTASLGGSVMVLNLHAPRIDDVADGLAAWPIESCGDDSWIGRTLGPGVIDHSVKAWHWGRFSDGTWQPPPFWADPY